MTPLEVLLALLSQFADLTTLGADVDLTAGRDDIAAAAQAVYNEGNMSDEVLAALDSAAETRGRIGVVLTAQAADDADRTARAGAALALANGELDGLADLSEADLASLAALTPEQLATLSVDDGTGDEPDLTPLEGLTPEELASLADLAELSADDLALLTPAGDDPADPPAANAGGHHLPGQGTVTHLGARRPASTRPKPQPVKLPPMVASGNLAGFRPGEDISDPEKLTMAFQAMFDATEGQNVNGPAKMNVATRRDPNTDRIGPQMSGDQVSRRFAGMEQAVRREGSLKAGGKALAASGGILAPAEIDYSQPTIGSTARPVRDQMLLRVPATRGALLTLPIPTLADVGGGIGYWDDEAGTNEDSAETKPVLVAPSPSPLDPTEVKAVTARLQYGEFRGRFFPEQIAALLELLPVAHARKAEGKLLDKIGNAAFSKHVVLGTHLDAATDLLEGLDRLTSQTRSFYRVDPTFPLIIGLPFWVKDLIRGGLARRSDTGTLDEKYAVADAQIESFFNTRHVSPEFYLDTEAGANQIAGTQNAGAVNPWQTSVVGYCYPAGSWKFLDGGQLNLGVYRDSTLNDTNDIQVFWETFEAAHFHGTFSFRTAFTLRPLGTSQIPIDATSAEISTGS